MATGFFKFGDLESGATMTVNVRFRLLDVVQDDASARTVPVPGGRALLLLRREGRDFPQGAVQGNSAGRRAGRAQEEEAFLVHPLTLMMLEA